MKEEDKEKLEKAFGKYDDETVDDDFEIKGKILRVHNKRVKDEITTDIRLARFPEEKDKKFILDLATIRGDCLDTANTYIEQVTKYYIKTGQKLPEDFEQEAAKRVDILSNTFMRRIDWISNLNINVANNYLTKLMVGSTESDVTDQPMDRLSKEIRDFKSHLKNQEKSEEPR